MTTQLLLIGDLQKTRRMLAWGFSADAYRIKLAHSRASVLELIEKASFHVACLDWKMRTDDAREIAELLRLRVPELPLVALIEGKEPGCRATRATPGVIGSLVSPFPIEQLHAMIRRHALAEPVAGRKLLEETPPTRSRPGDGGVRFESSDHAARRVMELALRAAKSNAAILILGETGTGKSLLARAVHEHSALRDQPFVTVNCPCLKHELLESELFGHTRGSFTGAVQDTWGKVAAANGGTLFLDEIGDLPLTLQPKLLRLLQEKQYERVGEAISRTAQVRIIAATNRNLKSEVAAGRFREDLYYRLNVIAIDMPPLRARPAEIMVAAEAFLETISAQLGKPTPSIGAHARRLLEGHRWPGNLRELRNVVERAAILAGGSELGTDDFPSLVSPPPIERYQIGGAISLQALENAHIQMVVANSDSLEQAARILEIDKSTLYRKRKQMESRVEHFTPATEVPASIAVATAS